MILAPLILTSAIVLAQSKSVHWHYEIQTIGASVSQYTSYESPGINASGHWPSEGKSIACPRRIKLGTPVVIEGHPFVCDDRTALWVERRFGDTFDIFVGEYRSARKFGRRNLPVTIYYK